MRELQSISHELLVTFCYRHRRINRQGSPGHGSSICVWAEAPLARSLQVSGSVVQWVACVTGLPCPLTATGLQLDRLAPRLAPHGQKGSRHSHIELRPE
jgi:hypothetical protein